MYLNLIEIIVIFYRNLSSIIDNTKSEVDRKSQTIKHPEEYRCVTTEESGKINKSILEKCSRLAELEVTHTREQSLSIVIYRC